MEHYGITRLIVDRESEHAPLTERMRSLLNEAWVTVVEDARALIAREPGERATLVLMRHRGGFVKKFTVPPGSPPCGERYLVTMLNCPFSCSYCYLQSHLDHRRYVVFTNTDDLAREIASVLATGPAVHLTTGELGDSLALDHLTGTTADLLGLLAGSGATLDVRTKSDNVDHLLDLPGRAGNLVITWTLGPEEQISNEEHGTATLVERLDAMRRASGAGIAVGVRFDPIIPHYYDLDDYRGILASLEGAVGGDRVVRFELGVLRFPPGLWQCVRALDPRSPLLRGEYFPDREGKVRLYRPSRVSLYRDLATEIRRVFPAAAIDLSMEDRTVWEDAGVEPR